MTIFNKRQKILLLFVLTFTLSTILLACAKSIPTDNPADVTTNNTQGEEIPGGDTEQQTSTVGENSNGGEAAEENENGDSTGSEQNSSEGSPSNGNSENTDSEENEAPESTPIPKDDLVKVKALYLTGWTVGNPKRLEHFIELANTTEINSYVVDIKDDDGYVGYKSEVPEVIENNAWMQKYDVDKVISAFHENGIHVIGRLVCFKDPVLSQKKPELAVKKTDGSLWVEKKDNNGNPITWLNPYERESWPYLISIAKEAVEKGFDEIQFDYVRFPTGNRKQMDFSAYSETKYDAINEFLAYARKELPGVILSADVYGIICESPEDTEDIGQYLEKIGMDIEYISPMLYPSHFALGQQVNGIKFAKPDLQPYEVVYNSLVKAKNRISQVEGYRADVRPYIQDFTAPWIGKGNYQTYGAKQAREQINAVYDAGYEQWIFWDPSNTYSEEAFEIEN
jgi:hypothetical protein